MKSISKMLCLAVMGGVSACSGRYAVGGEETGGAAGSSASGSAGSGAVGGMAGSAPSGVAGSDDGSAGASEGDGCVPPNFPPPLLGELAEPELVWQRVTKLIEGDGLPPPIALPETTHYAWVGDLVTQAFLRARATGAAPGAGATLDMWLLQTVVSPSGSGPSVNWGDALLREEPLLTTLMSEPVGEHGYGVFSEPVWLAQAPIISERGAGMLERLFGDPPPAPPEIGPGPQHSKLTHFDDKTGRQELEIAVAPPACASCHVLFDWLGYPYEHFDVLGDYRELDDELPIDTSGHHELAGGTTFDYADMVELGAQVAASCEARRGIVTSFARAALALEGESRAAQFTLVGPHRDRLQQAFVNSELRSYEDLVRAYAQSPLVLQR